MTDEQALKDEIALYFNTRYQRDYVEQEDRDIIAFGSGDLQPSGTCNFARIDNVQLRVITPSWMSHSSHFSRGYVTE